MLGESGTRQSPTSATSFRLDPKDARAYDRRGQAYGNKGDWDKAIADYSEAIQRDPKDAQVYGYRGLAYGYKGDWDKAIADYSEAIRLDPKAAWAYGCRGWADRKGRVGQGNCRLQ